MPVETVANTTGSPQVEENVPTVEENANTVAATVAETSAATGPDSISLEINNISQENSCNSTNLSPAGTSNDGIPPPNPDFNAPPPYEIAAKLPTYEEVVREKQLAGDFYPGVPLNMHGTHCTVPSDTNFLTMDADRVEAVIDTTLLGTDFMFYTAFFVAFIFNWIGFLLLMCFCHTIASRYGALAGFGLSLAKWTFIVQHSTELASRDNSWVWWLIMVFGLIICIRAILQYLSIKRGWHLLSSTHQERLLFFY